MFCWAMCSMCLAWAFVVAVPLKMLVIPVSSDVGRHMIAVVVLHLIAVVVLPTSVIVALASETVEATIKGLHLLTKESIFALQNFNFGLLDVESVHKSGYDLKKHMHGDCTLLNVATGGRQDFSWVVPEPNPMGDLDWG